MPSQARCHKKPPARDARHLTWYDGGTVVEEMTAHELPIPLPDDLAVRLAVPLDTLIGRDFSPAQIFVLSRLSEGPQSITDLVSICPLPGPGVEDIVRQMLSEGVLHAAGPESDADPA